MAGWNEWQQDLLPRLQGMFAFALWNRAENRLILARDRSGKKPLFYRNWRSTFAFGSRFDGVEALTETAQLSREALPLVAHSEIHPRPTNRVR